MASETDETKAKLLTYSYEQVLDATKHQDDKVGRLLTTIAFLTAAALALAGLGGAKAIAVPVELGGSTPGSSYELAVALVCLVAFLIGVSITVIQLIGSLSTPLRLPGLDPARRSPSTDNKNGASRKDAVPSTIYFHEIEKNTREEWKAAWESDTRLIHSRRMQSLVGETHNLALRTSFKYNRTNEATAVLTWALMALSLTVSFIAIIILDETRPLLAQSERAAAAVTLDWQDTLLLGVVLTTITFVWSVARMRHSRLGRDHEARKPLVRLQRAVVLGSALSIFWAASLPLLLSNQRMNLFSSGIGFVSMFTANCMAWATFTQGQSPRVNTGASRLMLTVLFTLLLSALLCLAYNALPAQDWYRALPWAYGSAAGSIIAALFAWRGGRVPVAPKRDSEELPDHEGPSTTCRRCEKDQHEANAGTIKWRVQSILVSAGLLSFMAQQFVVDRAYGWPLAATCGALTALVGVAVFEPTFMERRERHIKARRRHHAKAMVPAKHGDDSTRSAATPTIPA